MYLQTIHNYISQNQEKRLKIHGSRLSEMSDFLRLISRRKASRAQCHHGMAQPNV